MACSNAVFEHTLPKTSIQNGARDRDSKRVVVLLVRRVERQEDPWRYSSTHKVWNERAGTTFTWQGSVIKLNSTKLTHTAWRCNVYINRDDSSLYYYTYSMRTDCYRYRSKVVFELSCLDSARMDLMDTVRTIRTSSGTFRLRSLPRNGCSFGAKKETMAQQGQWGNWRYAWYTRLKIRIHHSSKYIAFLIHCRHQFPQIWKKKRILLLCILCSSLPSFIHSNHGSTTTVINKPLWYTKHLLSSTWTYCIECRMWRTNAWFSRCCDY